VYDQDRQAKVRVARPANCKTNCPACARTCPKVAIIFPKYAPGGPIAGEDVGPDGLKADVVNVEYSKLLGPDVMEKLRKRGRQ
jgi:ferredoxin